MAMCNSMVFINDAFMGDPIEEVMFESSHFEAKEIHHNITYYPSPDLIEQLNLDKSLTYFKMKEI